ncbi:S8 family peptidase [Deinococcus maricopensis]|uniref:Aqualysin 1 n=1 Tax=Deinococcus maricopensis (strain DSM 21211 / LMG 22137 / NRRL B-23946 / LB-34) TaxID=709986 RepID=E8UAX2_DEIML|nr:S8 family peptidase [Deinococcus maricopensis]ADV68211.1 Aqualysin 1 [Deinococcus maricopensis DSM 21211]
MHKQLTMTGILGLTLLLAGCGNMTAQTPTSPATTAVAGTAIPGEYIVVLNKGAISTAMSAQNVNGLVTQLGLDPQGVSVLHVYTAALNGFAAKLSDANLAKLKSNPAVAYVEQNKVVKATATQTNPPSWGLDRIDQRNLPLNSSYTYSSTGSGVTAYIIDTGINTTHSDFGGRASWGTNTTGDGQNTDCEGHGTHVAGTVGSTTYGVAKGVKLVAVKVLGCDGSGTDAGVIAGIDWVAKNHSGPSVANMSLGGGASTADDNAIANLYNSGVLPVVAAGNEDQNACNVSPARAPQAVTVGATMKTDRRPDVTNWGRTPDGSAQGSNYGSCLDLFAPGDNILSTYIGSNTATATEGGTSMASPHVAGAAALILGQNPTYTPAQITSALLNNATTGVVTNAGTGSPNKLLYVGGTTPPTTGGTTYTGTLSGTGASSYQPSSTGFTYAGGTLTGALTGPSGTDFDLFLQKRSSTGSWTKVASSEGSTSSENVTYNAANGTYRWQVYSYSGSGSFKLVEQK